MGQFYPEEYGPHRLEGHHPQRKSRRFRFLKDLSPGRILDVGCGNGDDLIRLKSNGWALYGVEPNPYAAAHARRVGIEVFSGPIEQAPFPESSFKVITLFHSLEHVHDPVLTLRQVARLLAPNGLVLVRTPNVASLNFRLFGIHWHGLEIPRHLYWFDPHCLRLLAERAGLHLRRWRCRSGARGFRYSLMSPARLIFRFRPLRLYTKVLFEWIVDGLRQGDVMEAELVRVPRGL